MYTGEDNLGEAQGVIEKVKVIEAPSSSTEQQSFSVEEALNTPGFAEFLANARDAETVDMGDAEAIAERFESFKHMGEATEGMQDFLASNESFKSLGIDFNTGGMPAQIAEHMRTMAYEQPEALAALSDTVTEFNKLNATIALAESSLDETSAMASVDELRNTLAGLRQKETNLNEAQKMAGFFSEMCADFAAMYEKFAYKHTVEKAQEWLAHNEGDPIPGTYSRADMEAFVEKRTSARKRQEIIRTVHNDYGTEMDPGAIALMWVETDNAIRETEAKLQTREWLEEQRANYQDTLDSLNYLIGQTVMTNKTIQQMAWRQVETELMTKVANPDAAFDYIETVRGSAVARMLDGGQMDQELEGWRDSVQLGVERYVTTEIEQALARAQLGSEAFTHVEQSLSSLINQDRIGMKEGIDLQAFIMDSLNKIIDKNKGTPQGRAKNILVRALAAKISADTGHAEIKAEGNEDDDTDEDEVMPIVQSTVGTHNESPAESPLVTKLDENENNTEYLQNVIRELTFNEATGRYMEAADIFGIGGVLQFPLGVREKLQQDEQFLDIVVDSLLITRHTWDSDLLAQRLKDIPYDFREVVFGRPKFIEILLNFMKGRYSIRSKDESLREVIAKLTPVLGSQIMNARPIQEFIASKRPVTEIPKTVPEVKASPTPKIEKKAEKKTEKVTGEVVRARPAQARPKTSPAIEISPLSEFDSLDAMAYETKNTSPVAEKPVPVAKPEVVSPVPETVTEAAKTEQTETAAEREPLVGNLKKNFKHLTREIDEFEEVVTGNRFNGVRIDTGTLEKLNRAKRFDPDMAREVISQIGRDIKKPFLSSEPANEEQVHRFENVITAVRSLYTNLVEIGGSISDELLNAESAYGDLSTEILSTMATMENRINQLSEAREALLRYLRR